jgi:DNA polymerase-3 subunit gamma/tau
LFLFYIDYMALYHKYRPQRFKDLVGQEHIKEILTNALREDKVGHAYLLSGPRGLGKTTTARLLAKAINCLKNDRTKDQPCNTCQLCAEIASGQALDVIEIDAASSRGIDDIRELRDKVRFAPTLASKKIYIIDEVHMLTKEAFNALLKTLEEPPAHALFIMVTTEPHKIPETILSRVQRFDFQRPTEQDLVTYLTRVAKKEKIKIDRSALEGLAKLAQGSFRDGVVLLDQVMSGKRSKIDLDWVLKSLGLASVKEVDSFIQAIEDQNLKEALKILDRLSQKGYDLKSFVELVITRLRKDLRCQEDSRVVFRIEVFLKALSDMPYSPDPTLAVELALYQLIESQGKKREEEGKEDRQRKRRRRPADNQSKTPIKDIHTGWKEIIQKVRKRNSSLASLLSSAVLEGLEGNRLNLVVKYQFYQDLIEQTKNRRAVEKIGLQILGIPISLRCKLDPGKVLEKEKKQEDRLAKEVDQILS